MKRIFLSVVLAAALGLSLAAQTIDTGSITAAGADCSTAARCAIFTPPAGWQSVTLQVSGTFSATLAFEATADGTNWVSVMAVNLADGTSATSTTAAGQFAINNSGLSQVRVRASAYASGTAVVAAVRGWALARWLAPYFRSLTVNAGTGTETAEVCGKIEVSTTSAATIANTIETDLWTWTAPANTMSANGRGLRFTAYGTLGATATAKTIRMYQGGSVISFTTGTTAASAGHWRLTADVIRSGASAQVISGFGIMGPGDGSVVLNTRSVYLGGSHDTTATIAYKVTGQNGTANANDIVFMGALVECF